MLGTAGRNDGYKHNPKSVCRYGPDGRTGREYNLTELHQSNVATALAKLGMPIPNDEKILALRKEADVTCKKPKNASPCKPTQQVKEHYLKH